MPTEASSIESDTFVGVATFELSPDGTRIAHSDTLDRTTFNFGPLIVTDVESDRPTTVSQDPVLAYQWSPNGESLLYLTTVSGADHPGFRWAVWNGENSRFFQPVTLTTTFATSYLPFWDQYSRSHRLWAPDGSAFAYSALTPKGTRPSGCRTWPNPPPGGCRRGRCLLVAEVSPGFRFQVSGFRFQVAGLKTTGSRISAGLAPLRSPHATQPHS